MLPIALIKYLRALIKLNLLNSSHKCPIPFANPPKSAFAMMYQQRGSQLLRFSFRILEFDNKRNDPLPRHNLEKMYHVKDGIILSDTRMCEVIDIIDPEDIVKRFPELFSIIQRQGALKLFKFNCGKLKNY